MLPSLPPRPSTTRGVWPASGARWRSGRTSIDRLCHDARSEIRRQSARFFGVSTMSGVTSTRPTAMIVVTGPPASGKTTIATALWQRLRVPLIAKDPIK